MRKSKNRYFNHIFVFSGDAPGGNHVVWMEREFDGYKLSRCMCRSNYYRFWDTARYLWKKSSFYHTPLHSTPTLWGFPLEYRHPLWDGKLECCRYPMVKNFWRYVYSFWRDPQTWQTDGRMDRQKLHDSKDRAYASHRAVKNKKSANCTFHWHTQYFLQQILQRHKETQRLYTKMLITIHRHIRRYMKLSAEVLRIETNWRSSHIKPAGNLMENIWTLFHLITTHKITISSDIIYTWL